MFRKILRLGSKVQLLIIILLIFFLFRINLSIEEVRGNVLIVNIKGEITEATDLLVKDALGQANAINSRLVIILLDTPGGSVSAVKDIMVRIEASNIPVAVFVYPVGATAWSGGVYVLMSSHIAVMASGTSIGSAQPIMETLTGPVFINETKIVNALTGLIEHHAMLHCRNVTAAKLFVTENLNMGPEDALKNHVIDMVADNVNEFLKELENKALIKFESNAERVWKLIDVNELNNYKPLKIIYFKSISDSTKVNFIPGPQVYILNFLTNPLIAELLFLIGIFILSIGLKTPGYGLEIIGSLMIAASIIGLGVIGIEIGGLMFIIIGIILLLFELKTHIGALAILGSISVIAGSLMLIPSGNLWISKEEMEKMWASIVGLGVTVMSIFALLVFKVAKAQRRKPVIGPKALIGKIGITISDLNPDGEMRVEGEIWHARSISGKIRKGERVKVIKREGLVLLVKKI